MMATSSARCQIGAVQGAEMRYGKRRVFRIWVAASLGLLVCVTVGGVAVTAFKFVGARRAEDSLWRWYLDGKYRDYEWTRANEIVRLYEERVVPNRWALRESEFEMAREAAALAYVELGDYEESKKAINNAAMTSSGFIWCNVLIDALVRRKQWSLLRVEAHNSSSDLVRAFGLARVEVEQGEADAAILRLQQVVKADPAFWYGEPFWLLARAEALKGNGVAAKAYLDRYLALVGDLSKARTGYEFHSSFVRSRQATAYARMAQVLIESDRQAAQVAARKAIECFGDIDSWYRGPCLAAERREDPPGIMLTWAGQKRDLDRLKAEVEAILQQTE